MSPFDDVIMTNWTTHCLLILLLGWVLIRCAPVPAYYLWYISHSWINECLVHINSALSLRTSLDDVEKGILVSPCASVWWNRDGSMISPVYEGCISQLERNTMKYQNLPFWLNFDTVNFVQHLYNRHRVGCIPRLRWFLVEIATVCPVVSHLNPLLVVPLRWRHHEHDSVSNHQPYHCLLNCLFRHRSKKTSKLRVIGLCVGNSPGTGEFPAQMASNAENVSIWWRHHALTRPGFIWCLFKKIKWWHQSYSPRNTQVNTLQYSSVSSEQCQSHDTVRYIAVTSFPNNPRKASIARPWVFFMSSKSDRSFIFKVGVPGQYLFTLCRDISSAQRTAVR